MRLIHWNSAVLAVLVTLGCVAGAKADQLVLKNGSVIVGKLVSATANKVVYDTPFAGRISIKQENIVSITTDEPVTLKMKSGAAI